MRKTWGSLLCAFGFVGAVAAASIAGCGSEGPRPQVGDLPQNDASVINPGGGSSDGSAGGKDASVAKTCGNTIKDDAETDVDCGGNGCTPCLDGKTCIAKTDCLGGACLNGFCVTPACSDNATNGDETDTDCGGSVCKRCTIGKRCSAGTDCVSGSCNQNACTCPKGMATASRAGGGGAYCIDEIEVSKFEYNRFITANVLTSDQLDVCKPPVNTTFIPRGAWPPAVAPPSGLSIGVAQAFNLALPIHYVDWCDASAYCKWANKQLCGGITGGAADFTKSSDAAADAWYNACSAQGSNTYPYSGPFIAGKCNGGEGLHSAGDSETGPTESQRNGYGAASNQDEGVNVLTNGGVDGNYTVIEFGGCQGGVTGLFQMSGNVAEWEDSCDATTATAQCHLRGGSYKAGTSGSTALACAAQRTETRVPPAPTGTGDDVLKDIGIRCCLF